MGLQFFLELFDFVSLFPVSYVVVMFVHFCMVLWMSGILPCFFGSAFFFLSRLIYLKAGHTYLVLLLLCMYHSCIGEMYYLIQLARADESILIFLILEDVNCYVLYNDVSQLQFRGRNLKLQSSRSGRKHKI